MKSKLVPFLLLMLFGWQLSGQINPCNWKFRKRIAFDPNQVSGSTDLTDFPALITFTIDGNLETVANGGNVQNNNGYDIIFTADDGVTPLNHDLEEYSPTTGSFVAWVKIPTLSTSITTYIYMYYGNAAVTTNQSSPSTWSNNYVGVYHFINNGVRNSTSIANMNGTNAGSTPTALAKFDTAQAFVRASSQYFDITPYNSAYDIVGDITVSLWARLFTLGNDQKFVGNEGGVLGQGGWKFGAFTDNKIEFEIRTSGNVPFLSRSAAGGSALAANTWYYVVGQYSDVQNFIKTYRNGTVDRTYTMTATTGTSSNTMIMGKEPFSNTAFLDGIMDEIRISNVIRSPDWIATEYANQNSPSTFYSISAQPKLWDGSSSSSWTTTANWTPTGQPTIGQDVIIQNIGTQPVLNNSTASIGAMWVHPSATFNNGNSTRTLSVAFDLLNCGTITGSLGTIQLNTTTIQVQHISGAGTWSLNNLRVDNQFNVNPSTNLNTSVTVNGSLVLNSGIVGTSTTNLLLMTSTAVSTDGNSQSFINGPMAKVGNADFVFPVGKGQEWRRIRVSNISASSTWRAEYFTNPYSSTTPVTTPLDNVSQVEYWQLDRTAGTGSANVALYWENVSSSGIDDCPDLEVARWTGSTWQRLDATAVGSSSCSGAGTGTIMTNAQVGTFSPFSFGSTTPGINGLPLKLLDFSGTCEPGKVYLKWATTNERNTKSFTIERSFDGVTYEALGAVDARGAKQRTDYSFDDHAPTGVNTYYRLKQQDNDGAFVYSSLVVTNCTASQKPLTVYPNPNSGEFTVSGLLTGSKLQIINASGQVLQSFEKAEGILTLSIEQQGFYVIRVTDQSGDHALKVVVQ